MEKKLSIFKSISSDTEYWGDDITVHVKCPECGEESAHIENPKIIDENDIPDAIWDGRSDVVVIPIWGECGSKWEMCFGFHKGYTGAFVRL